MLKQVCYGFTALNKFGTDPEDSKVLAVDVEICHDSNQEHNWGAEITIGVRTRIDKKWITEDLGLEPFNKETAIALRDFLIFCFPLTP